MKNDPVDFRRWQIHIRKQSAVTPTPDSSETISPLRFDWELYGRILEHRPALRPLMIDWTECYAKEQRP